MSFTLDYLLTAVAASGLKSTPLHLYQFLRTANVKVKGQKSNDPSVIQVDLYKLCTYQKLIPNEVLCPRDAGIFTWLWYCCWRRRNLVTSVLLLNRPQQLEEPQLVKDKDNNLMKYCDQNYVTVWLFFFQKGKTYSLYVNTTLYLHYGQLADVMLVGWSIILEQESAPILRPVKKLIHTHSLHVV